LGWVGPKPTPNHPGHQWWPICPTAATSLQCCMYSYCHLAWRKACADVAAPDCQLSWQQQLLLGPCWRESALQRGEKARFKGLLGTAINRCRRVDDFRPVERLNQRCSRGFMAVSVGWGTAALPPAVPPAVPVLLHMPQAIWLPTTHVPPHACAHGYKLAWQQQCLHALPGPSGSSSATATVGGTVPHHTWAAALLDTPGAG
jgi:hypothetical protein